MSAVASSNSAATASIEILAETVADAGSVVDSSVTPLKPVRLTAGRVEKLVTSLERIAVILSSLGAETREVNKAIKILLKPTTPAAQTRKLNPSAYNLFIQRTMPVVRADHPDATAKERMQICASLWKKSKEEHQQQEAA